MEYNNYQEWRKGNYIPTISSNISRRKFLEKNWIEFQELFFNYDRPIELKALTDFGKRTNGIVNDWFYKKIQENDLVGITAYYKESKICELIRNRKLVNSIQSVAEEYRTKLVNNPTESELKFKRMLESKNIPYKYQEIIYIKDDFGIIENFYIVDFLVGKTIIEIDGRYHSVQKQMRKDNIRTEKLKSMGYEVKRFSNYSINRYKE